MPTGQLYATHVQQQYSLLYLELYTGITSTGTQAEPRGFLLVVAV